MKVSYNGLWKILIDKNMNKKELTEVCELSPATVSKMGRGEFVSMDVLYRMEIWFQLLESLKMNNKLEVTKWNLKIDNS